MLKEIKVPKEILDSLKKYGEKQWLTIEKILSNSLFQEYITSEDFYKYQPRGLTDSTPRPDYIDQKGGIFLVKYEGICLIEDKDKTNENLFELHKKAKELDDLKKSLANIKSVIGEIK